jgi:histidinol dehydrogenase
MLKVLNIDNAADRSQLDGLVGRLRAMATGGDEKVAGVVRTIVQSVQNTGDAAVIECMRRFTRPTATAGDIRIDPALCQAAWESLNADLRGAIERSIDHVRRYQQHIMPTDPQPIDVDGASVGLRFTPIERVGLTVPGGRADYPSTLIMLAVPAQVAGVKEIAVCCPPPNVDPAKPDQTGEVSQLVLGAAYALGLTELYRLGGAEAVAAMTYSTETVKAVDFIAGPGNVFSQLAKRQVFGLVGIDGFFGPSEVVVLADETAKPDRMAAELICQAEHDPGCCFLVSSNGAVIEAINKEIAAQLPQRKRREAIEQALRDWSFAVVVRDEAGAYAMVDRLAAEHVVLAVADPQQALGQVQHGGAFFLGDQTPVASGDYYAGPSHALPTGTTARFTSGASVYTFLKRSSVECYPRGMDAQAITDIAALAEAEGLEAHAESAKVRKR